VLETRKGFAAAVAAFAIWGFLPLYFIPLREVSAVQVVAHRVIWSWVLVLASMTLRGELSQIRATWATRGVVLRLAASAIFISINWLLYVWAVAHNHVVDASLGYFITPLVNVLLGVVVLAERLNRAQWTAVALAAVGVSYLTVETGNFLWISLTLGFSFACYGLIRKVVRVEALAGLAAETLMLMPFAVAYLIWCEATGSGALGHRSLAIDALLVGSGPVTAFALFLFAYGARRIPYSTTGVLNYIAPTLQLACGVFVFREPFARAHLVGFTLIWAAVLIYAGDRLLSARRQE
jgi:chloramphenicol-sensitive protein RarD